MVDDSSYLTPHETALAVVATAMKKARLQLDTLVVNSILGGILFSSGSFLLVAIHSDDPDMVAQNPGLVNFIAGITFAIGLFYVVIMGADLFNSNILFFSVGIMRGAVTIYDLIISWLVSWLGNIAGSLFVSYLFGHLTGIGSQELWIKGSKQIIEQKASFSFIQTFLKGIAGNFFVCLAIYLQLMAKPIHVKFIIMSFPIITFVTIGFTHVVADMSPSFIALLNGANVSVGEYIWKLLIPASLGNIVGGIFFSAVIPFYLHLVVVERDRKRLSLPEYEARDEQPELNMDSRVVRIPKHELKEERNDGDDDDTTETGGDIEDLNEKDSTSLFINAHDSSSILTGRSLNSLSSIPSSAVTSENATMESNFGEPMSFIPIPNSTTNSSHLQLRHNRSTKSVNNRYSKKHRSMRSPPGVFPVRGMGEPLEREKTIEDATYDPKEDNLFLKRAETHNSPFVKNNDNILRLVKTEQNREQNEYEENGGYNILENKPGTKLEKMITHFAEGLPSKESTPPGLPRTTQDTFPYNAPASSPTYTDNIHSLNRANSTTLGGLFRAISRDFHTSKDAEILNDPLKKKSTVGINRKASNVPETINLDTEELSRDSRQQHITAPKS